MDLLTQYAQFLKNGGLIPYAQRGLDYLRRSLLGDPPPTSPVSSSYTPPFTGGQCDGGYYVEVVATYPSITKYGYYNGLTFYDRLSESAQRTTNLFPYKLESLEVFSQSNGKGLKLNGIVIAFFGLENFTQAPDTVTLGRLLRANGQPDNCGDLPNPNAAPSIALDGLASAAALDLGSSALESLTQGTPLEPDGSADALEEAEDDLNEAGDLAPTNPNEAIKKIADGLVRLVEFLKLLNDLLTLLKKLLNKDNKSSYAYHFGNLRYDGFVRLLSEPPDPKVTPIYLDLQVTHVKVGASRIFGQKSPNYYNREPIGYIHFVSSTFGILSSHEVRFIRTSIPIHPLSYGFFYNFGSDGVNRANASGFYLKQVE